MYESNPRDDLLNQRLGGIIGPEKAAMGALLANLLACMRANSDPEQVLEDLHHHERMVEIMGREKHERLNRMMAAVGEQTGEFRPPSVDLTEQQDSMLMLALRSGDVALFCSVFRQVCVQLDLGSINVSTVCVPVGVENSAFVQFIADFRNLNYGLPILGAFSGSMEIGGVWHSSQEAVALQKMGVVPGTDYDDPNGDRFFRIPISGSEGVIEGRETGEVVHTPPGELLPTQKVDEADLPEADQRGVWWLAHLLRYSGVASDGTRVAYQCS